jgi:hypothetical protein
LWLLWLWLLLLLLLLLQRRTPALACMPGAIVRGHCRCLLQPAVQETQTKPEGQIHFFPVIFNGKQLYEVMLERCGPTQNSGRK